MPTELAQPRWELPPLTPDELGPYGDFPRVGDAEKARLGEDYRAGRPSRVPVALNTNNRVLLLDPRIDVEGLTYERTFNDAKAMVLAQLRWQYLLRQRYGWLCDRPTGLPDVWDIEPEFHSVYEAAGFGAPLHFHERGIPEPALILAGDGRDRLFGVNLDRLLDEGFFHHTIELSAQMADYASGCTFLERPIRVKPYTPLWSDGPLTVMTNLRGTAILTDVKRDPQYAQAAFEFVTTAAIRRFHAFRERYGLPEPEEVWFADDAIAMLSTAQLRDWLLPHYRRWYEAVDPQRRARRMLHACGDATRHFPLLRDELGLYGFDTGFPVDFAALRRTLGPDVEIQGGVDVPTLVDGTPDEVYARARAILTSGVLDGRRLIFREGNNLPPGAPWANLAAMYQAAFDFGQYPA